MRHSWISTAAGLFAAFALCGTSALSQTRGSDTRVAPKHVVVEGDDHYNRMTTMGRLAYAVSQVRAQRPGLSRGQTLHAAMVLIDPNHKPDSCGEGDEDCDATGYQEGPGATQSEMSIAVDVTGMHIVVGFNDFRGFGNPQSVSGFAYSDDGGVTFTDGGQLPTNSNGQISGTLLPQVDGDPDVKWVPGGAGCQFIYSSILLVGLPKASAPNFTGTAQTMSVHRSIDCGHTWSGPFEVTAATNPTGVLIGPNARDAADKEFIDVDPDTGRVMMSWSNFTAVSVIPGGVQISTTFSDNIMTGNPPTWSSPVVLNPGSTTFDTGSMPRFAGGGSPLAYVAWATASNTTGLGNTRVAKSPDNGLTFTPSVALNASDFFPADQVLGDDRIHSFPFIAVDTSGGPRAGNVYVSYLSNNNFDGGDIAFHRSSDSGATFTPATLINARPGNDRSQWFPVLTTDSSTGRVNVMFDDQGTATSGDLMQMTWMYSDDGGVTWSKPSPLTRPFHAGYGNDTSQPNLGDYNAGATRNGAFYVAFPTVPNVVNFNDGQPTAFIGYPTFLGNSVSGGTAPSPGFAKVTAAAAALDLGSISFTDSGGDGNLDSGDSATFTIPLRNYVTNPVSGPLTYTGVSGTLSTATPGVTILQPTATYPNIAPGGVQSNGVPYVLQLGTAFVPGTKIDLSLSVSTGQGSTTLLFTENTGTPVPTTIFSENFDSTPTGTLPAGWTPIHVGGTPVVPWTTNNSFCGASSNGLFHQNANDTSGSNRTRFERVASPNITIPASSQYVTIDFDICYDTEDDPSFNILAYDGADLRITDFTAGHFARANFVEALADTFTTGTLQHYPKHNPRNSNGNYFQDISLWAGDSSGFKHVSMRFNGMAGDTVQLRPDFTQDSFGTCTAVRPTHLTCGVMIDNLVVKSIVSHVTIATASLPTAFVGLPYSQTLTALAGVPPYFWTLTSGRLPAGLTFNGATGQISGTPTNESSSILTFQVTDSSSPPQTATVRLTLTVSADILSITTTSLPAGQVGVPYSQTLAAAGGTPPYTWALNPGAALPNGLTLNPATGVISGTPTTPVSRFRVLVTATDSTMPVNQTSSAAYVMTIN